jgi:hypothetical protein
MIFALVAMGLAGCSRQQPKLVATDLSSAGLNVTVDAPEGAKITKGKSPDGETVVIASGDHFKMTIQPLDQPFDIAEKKAFWVRSKDMILETYNNAGDLYAIQIKEPAGPVHASFWYAATVGGQHYLCKDEPVMEGPYFDKADVETMIKCAKSMKAK